MPKANTNTAKYKTLYHTTQLQWQRLRQHKPCKGNSNLIQYYSYEDADVLSVNPQLSSTNSISYRLQMFDKDGSFTYSRIVLLKNKINAGGYVIYPNPANNFIAVSAGYDAVNKATLQLYDATGRLLLNKTMTSSSEEINTSQYSGGTYMLRMINDGEVVTYKVIIQH